MQSRSESGHYVPFEPVQIHFTIPFIICCVIGLLALIWLFNYITAYNLHYGYHLPGAGPNKRRYVSASVSSLFCTMLISSVISMVVEKYFGQQASTKAFCGVIILGAFVLIVNCIRWSRQKWA